jgi:hypothetical protein
MSDDDGWQRYVDAANAVRQLARSRVEEIARELLSTGESGGDHARQWTEDLLERSRAVVDEVVEVVRSEVARQLDTLGIGSPEDLLRRLTETFAWPGRTERPQPRDAAPIEASSVTGPARPARAEKSAATAAPSKQRTPKPKGAGPKTTKKAGAAKKGAPHGAARAAQKTAKPDAKSSAKRSGAKKSSTKKSAGRGT